jgi:hypothetical protein
MSRRLQHQYRPLVLVAGAALVTALALAMLVGYATSTADLPRWGPYIQMASHTACGFLLIGMGMLAFACVDERAHLCSKSLSTRPARTA